MGDIIFAEEVAKMSRKKLKEYAISFVNPYAHPTFVIDNLADYIRVVSSITSVYDDSIYEKSIVFRGVTNHAYNLTPGLGRLRKMYDDTENTMINDFCSRRPEAFDGLSEFDMIAKMQHYGLPTRLLDFTLNPLVALFFACESKFDIDGRVFCHSSYLNNDSSQLLKTICKTAVKGNFDENRSIKEYLNEESISIFNYLSEVYLHGETLVVKPKYWNQRIINQSGVFMVFPNELVDRYRIGLLNADKLGVDTSIKECVRGKISKSLFAVALDREPLEFYRTENSVFLSDADYKSMFDLYKAQENKTDFIELVSDRFNINLNLKHISRQIIQEDFCSIIIPKNKKKKIINELSRVGISIDYIYPELEYTAKQIRDKFQ